LFDIETLKKIDKNEICKVYDRWPEIAEKCYNSEFEVIKYKNISHIIFAGMGGSGIIGDIFSSILSKTKIHVTVVKGYNLPKTVNKNTLVIATSISGNTIETLTILKSAKKAKCKIVGFSGGGKLKNYCLKNNIEYRFIEIQHSPRASLTQFLYSMLNILHFILQIKKQDVIESINLLKKTQKEIYSKNFTKNNRATSLAECLEGIPMIYYPWGLQAAAIRFKNSLQENVKCHAITEDLVEACHNGIVSWERTSIVKPIIIEGKDDFIKTKERIKILKKYFIKNNIKFDEVCSVSGGILSKLINLIYLLDYTSIYLAIKLGIDPTPVKSIDFIKQNL